MQRPIKFRAKTLEGEWIDFELHESYFSGDPGTFYVGSVPCEVGTERQYTGLKDRNGVEIYEGDIVKDNIFGLYTVFFSYGGFKLIGVNELSNQLALMDSHSNWYEVIGNIYENPELMEANQ